MKKSRFDVIRIITKNTVLLWKNARGVIDDNVANKMDDAMLNWLVDLTDCLSIWMDKGETLTEGELILARVNLGTLVESWLKLFYCVYYLDYLKKPVMEKRGLIEPNDLSFDKLKKFSIDKLWDNKNDPEYIWVDKVQNMRNAIHAFNYKNIGTAKEFFDDLEKFYDFVVRIYSILPPIEDYIEVYPTGYEPNVYFE